MIRVLPTIVPAAPGKPTRAGASTMQAAATALAVDPALWTAQAGRESVERYAELAPTWDEERGGYRSAPLADALARGGRLPPGLCVEAGCGTGLLTPLLAAVWQRVLSLDLSWHMLRRSPAPWRVLGDASRLPLGDRRAAAVVLADAPLFAGEVTRVLADDGIVIWSNALGREAPHHVPVDVVLAALRRAAPDGAWDVVTAEAGWGLWAVFHRAGQQPA